MKAEQAWQAVLGQLQMDMPRASYDTWVKNANVVSYEDNVFFIGVPNTYARDWLDSRLSSKIKRLLCGIMNRTVEVRFVVWQAKSDQPSPDLVETESEQPSESLAPEDISPRGNNIALLSRYSFDNYIVGSS